MLLPQTDLLLLGVKDRRKSRSIFSRTMNKPHRQSAKPRAARSRARGRADRKLCLIRIPGLPEIRKGEDLAKSIVAAARKAGLRFEAGDVLVVAQKIVSKAEGLVVSLGKVIPSAKAQALAAQLKKDPRAIELVLRESRRILRSDRVLITETHHGFVCANAGVDHSNVAPEDGGERVLLLPIDPDGSADKLRRHLIGVFGVAIGVIISDSFGRPWRKGTVGVALGADGLPAFVDLRGRPDLFGRELLVTETGFADEIAAAAGLLMGQADEAIPMVLVRGLAWSAPDQPAAALVRPAEHDLFR